MANLTAAELAAKTREELNIILNENAAELKEIGDKLNAQAAYRRAIISELTASSRKDEKPPE